MPCKTLGDFKTYLYSPQSIYHKVNMINLSGFKILKAELLDFQTTNDQRAPNSLDIFVAEVNIAPQQYSRI